MNIGSKEVITITVSTICITVCAAWLFLIVKANLLPDKDSSVMSSNVPKTFTMDCTIMRKLPDGQILRCKNRQRKDSSL